MQQDSDMGSQKLLLEWCRLQCENYPSVQIKDLTTSFKDGLAFCAIIHKHRPDLLDFHSLSKDSGYENNRLAFEIAETHLGIPAVLDPADMVSMEVPDRLSVITYLSQYFIHFAKPSDADFRNFRSSEVQNPYKDEKKGLLLSQPIYLPRAQVTNISGERGTDQSSSSSSTAPGTAPAPAHLCTACMQRVHLVQRHMVDGKLYHRHCFRCRQCCSTLFPGSYRTDSETGLLFCSNLCLKKPNAVSSTQHKAEAPADGPKEARTPGMPPVSTSLIQICTARDGQSFKVHEESDDTRESSQDMIDACIEIYAFQIDPPPEIKNGNSVADEQSSTVNEDRDHAKESIPGKRKETEELKEVKHQRQTLEKEKFTVDDTKRTGVRSGPPGSTPTQAEKPGTNSRPVPAPRRPRAQRQEPSMANPPWPPPRAGTGTAKAMMDRSKSEGQANKITSKPGEESPSVSRSSDKGSESPNPKSPPWMDLIHPGPWAKLPPVPLPRQPPRSTSVPFLSEMWSRQKSVHLSPGNPFEEDEDEEDLTPEGSNGATCTAACPEGNQSHDKAQSTVVTSSCHTPQCGTGTDGPVQVSDHNLANSPPRPPLCMNNTPACEGESISKTAGVVCSEKDLNGPGQCHFATARDNQTSKTDCPQQPTQCVNTAPASEGELVSKTTLAVCSGEDSSPAGPCRPAKANKQESEAKTHRPAEANGVANGSQAAAGPSGVSDLAETAGSVCSLKLAEAVTVPEACRLDSSAGRSELETLPKSALASLPPNISVADTGQTQDPPATCTSELQIPNPQHSHQSKVSSSSPTGSLSDVSFNHHSNSTGLMVSDSPTTNKKPELPSKPNVNKGICKENPFNRAATLAEIPCASSSISAKPAAPGHGFPLIKRKVQSDQDTLGKDLQTERGELSRQLDGLEQKGVELEKSLRNCQNEKEDDLLVNWFTLIHEKHVLVRRDAELVYLAKQQTLEERQSDVEYELRCLLNKPEKEWSPVDRAREKQLMADLVTVIEQRNQIINNLDQDRQREQEEDLLLEDMMKRRDFQRPSEHDGKKTFSRKFKPMKILKQLGHKTESKKEKTKTSPKKN
ncbi:MICAL-like protein 1 [Engraulis encrasicolus]|uniref:MICAL-like protein 1 n=1 Tax=Engraulis encrasicolus TaxID=184585 RepID=UPI002FD01F7A